MDAVESGRGDRGESIQEGVFGYEGPGCEMRSFWVKVMSEGLDIGGFVYDWICLRLHI